MEANLYTVLVNVFSQYPSPFNIYLVVAIELLSKCLEITK